ncbi:MarR family winged helix-turn-helix transcriptional regulator [Brevundimonas pondensis]|uniref:MarR family transcriptional regulator n=1 Tax=Brevundimonas pondensis TaxID=2774189 RepID=A0ABX7SN82_9CAUL|nr:MarR family transcriptional regulator [Brevundimonas pondensis]QTC89156.1 MarR family transcriptional regulator [Brevundimonas pondensis]
MPDRASRAAAQWAVQRPDMDMLPMEALGRLHEASILVARERQAPLYARYGLQQGEFDALATLRRSGAPEGLTPTALFEAAMMSSGGMTARIDRLEKAGLVARGPHPTDRRATLVRLTDKGFDLIETIMPEHEEAARDILAPLSLDEQKTLNALLARLIGGLCD